MPVYIVIPERSYYLTVKENIEEWDGCVKKEEDVSRAELLALLSRSNAHMSFEEAVEDFPESAMNTTFPNVTYTPWHLLEHMRRSQWDILDFMRNPNYKGMVWPDDYWPQKSQKATRKEWDKTIEGFNRDMKELQLLVSDPKVEMHSRIPHGDGQTMLREILLVADHNAYHTGEFTIMRQVMGTWGKDHK